MRSGAGVALFALLAVVLAAALAACGGSSDTQAAAEPAATIGEVTISFGQLDERVAHIEEQYAGQTPDPKTNPEEYAQFRRSVLEYMVRLEILRQRSESLGVAVNTDDVQAEIDTILTDYFAGDQTAFDSALADEGLTLDELKASIQEQLLMEKAYEAVSTSIASAPDERIQEYYDAHLTDYYQEETRTASHILVMPGTDATTSAEDATTAATTTTEPTEEEWSLAEEEIEKIRAEIEGGLEFAEAARLYSDDTYSKESGGELGVVYQGDMVEEFDAALFSMAAGELSQPVKTQYGYHLIKLTEITPGTQLTLDEVKDEVSSIVVQELQADAWEEWIAQAKVDLPVTYADGMAPTTTTTAPASEVTSTT